MQKNPSNQATLLLVEDSRTDVNGTGRNRAFHQAFLEDFLRFGKTIRRICEKASGAAA